jgi:uncharacterized protein
VAFMSLPERLRSGEFSRPKIIPGVLWGSISGFTSMVSHSGGPPFLVYVMPQRLSPPVLAGTSTIFFAAVNLLKVPPYFALGQFTSENLWTSAVMLPVAILSTLAGVWLVRRVSVDAFYGLILGMTLLVGLKLTYDAVSGLLP